MVIKMNYYNEIKKELINNEINRKVKNYSINKSDLNTYYNVGKMLSLAGKHYGEGIIKEYSIKLTNDLSVKYDVSSLNKMKKFYFLIQKVATVSPNLSYSHYVELLPFDNIDKIKYYVRISEKLNLSVRQLREKIKSKEYERLPEDTKSKLYSNEMPNIIDLIKNPIIIKNSYDSLDIAEKQLQKLILENIPSFLKELGIGFTFVENEYKIRIGNTFNYIDLLLFNYEYNCFVVLELKVTELKKEHIGQIQVYMNYIDDKLRKFNQEKTIGIIICKQDNNYVIKYCSDKRIIARKYKLI